MVESSQRVLSPAPGLAWARWPGRERARTDGRDASDHPRQNRIGKHNRPIRGCGSRVCLGSCTRHARGLTVPTPAAARPIQLAYRTHGITRSA
eukprot:832161-Prymnesium_polylepis.1